MSHPSTSAIFVQVKHWLRVFTFFGDFGVNVTVTITRIRRWRYVLCVRDGVREKNTRTNTAIETRFIIICITRQCLSCARDRAMALRITLPPDEMYTLWRSTCYFFSPRFHPSQPIPVFGNLFLVYVTYTELFSFIIISSRDVYYCNILYCYALSVHHVIPAWPSHNRLQTV